MKFGKFYQEQLQTLGVPQKWLDKAVDYKELKKVIHKYMEHVEKLGLNKDSLKLLLKEGELQIITNNFECLPDEEEHQLNSALVRTTTNSSDFSIEKYLNRDKSLVPETNQKISNSIYSVPASSLIGSKALDLGIQYGKNPFDTNTHFPGSAASSVYSFAVQATKEKYQDDSSLLNDSKDDSIIRSRHKYITQFSIDEFEIKILGFSDDVLEYKKSFAKYQFNDNDKYLHPKLRLYLINPAYTKRNEKHIQSESEDDEKNTELSSTIILKIFGCFNEANENDESVQKLDIHEINYAYLSIDISAINDDYFFRTIIDEINGLSTLTEELEKDLAVKIRNTKKVVESYSQPKRFRTDKSVWRQIFEMYTEYRIFFQTDDLHGERPFGEAEKRLRLFQKEIIQSHLASRFNHKQSRLALKEFIELNAELLISLKYNSLNKIAIEKILKKFDKRTSLGIKKKFPVMCLNQGDSFLKKSVVHDIYTSISSEVVSIVPMIENYYDCPVCFMLAYRPITLNCGHTFCLQCVLNMKNNISAKRKKKGNPSSNIEEGNFDEEDACPVCRAHTIELADITNINVELMNFMELHFPKECQEKIKMRKKEIDEQREKKYYQMMNLREGAECIIC